MPAGINTKGKMQITELDFDGIKSNLKTYLKGQNEFTDYDFEGSSMNILLDTLAYNTHYNAFMANMLANEMFLDTSQKRNSVTSHAKALGYTPTSVRAPVAYVKVRVNDAKSSNVIMAEGHSFSAKLNGVTYNFVNTVERIIQPQSGIYEFGSTNGIPIYEGTWTTTTYTADSNNVDQRFIIPNKNVDISTMTVQVQTSSTDMTTETYSSSETMVDIKNDTRAYFIQEAVDGLWEIQFGDDVIGKDLIDGNTVKIKYVVTNGPDANGVASFISSDTISGYQDVSVETLSSSSGGSDIENLESIKNNAPFSYAAQKRAVTSKDYETIIPTIYPNIESISVWGGEYADPPVYGKVFISIRPISGTKLTESTKHAIKTSLESYNVASVTPVILDPETIKVVPSVSFKYNNTVTNKTKEDLASLISKMIVSWSEESLEKHESIFRYSKFVSQIDDVDSSILSNITSIRMSKTFRPTINTKAQYTISFDNSIFNPSHELTNKGKGISPIGVIFSSGYKYVGDNNVYYYEDDGIGNIKTYFISHSDKVYKSAPVGKVDYNKGTIILFSENIASVENYDGAIQYEIRLTVIPHSNDIVPVRNQVLEIDIYNLSVTGEADSIASGSADGGTQYTTKGSFSY